MILEILLYLSGNQSKASWGQAQRPQSQGAWSAGVPPGLTAVFQTQSQQHQAQQLFQPGSKPTQQKPGCGGPVRPHNTKEKESPNLAEAGLLLGMVTHSTKPVRGKEEENAPPQGA